MILNGGRWVVSGNLYSAQDSHSAHGHEIFHVRL